MSPDISDADPSPAPLAEAGVIDETDVKDKFRQALERKRGHQADRDAAADGLGASKIQSEHAAAKTQRTFRRKSGG